MGGTNQYADRASIDDPMNVDRLERVTQKLVRPPFVPDHDQIASGAPKVVQVRLVTFGAMRLLWERSTT